MAKEHGVKLKKGWVKDVRKVFKMVDTDKSGSVSGKEMKAAIEKYGYPDLSDLVAKEDHKKPKGSKKIQFKIDEVFNHMDANKDGEVTQEEAKKAISEFAAAHGHKITEEEWAELGEMFDHIDANDDGKITMAEVETAIWEHVDKNGDGEW